MEYAASAGMYICMYAAAESLQSCRTLCNPTDGRPPGSPIPGILQARPLEWVAISFSSMCVCVCVCVCVYSDMCVYVCRHIRVSQVVQLVKSMSANAGDQEMRVQSLGQENPPE